MRAVRAQPRPPKGDTLGVVLLEREAATSTLRAAVDQARSGGTGRFIAIGGEAGVGKTSLLRNLAEEEQGHTAFLWGACDSLTTPRPLGPLVDVASAAGGDLRDALVSGAPREQLFSATLRFLTERSVVVIIEDAHWADEATIDFLTFLRRRAATTSSVVAVTYRDDEVGTTHPLRVVLEGPVAANEDRVYLQPLSPAAVAELAAGTRLDPLEVHRVTGGNSFFVTEVLAAGDPGAARTVRDAVLARAVRLPPDARAVLDVISIVPVRVEPWLIDRLTDDPAQARAVDVCVEHGVLRQDGDGVRFRHELARRAIRDAVTPIRRRELHERALRALVTPPNGVVDHARAAHHAFEAGDAEAVLLHAREAAAESSRVGAHRQAVQHLDHALRYVGLLPLPDRVALWREAAMERLICGEMDRAVAAFDTAIELSVEAGDRRAEGDLRSRRSAPLVTLGRITDAAETLGRGLELLEPCGPTPELAQAYVYRTTEHMLARRFAEAEYWSQRAIALQEELGRSEQVAHTLVQGGVAAFMSGDPDGLERIRKGQVLAREVGAHATVALGYSQIGSGGGEIRRYDVAIPALLAGRDYALEHDLMSSWGYAVAWLGRCRLELGEWDEAAELLSTFASSPWCTGISRMVTLTALGRLRARRGDPGAWPLLDEALELARETGHLQRLWPAAVGRAEAAWLEGRLTDEVRVLQEAHALAVEVGYGWALGQLAEWLVRAESPPSAIAPAAEPHRLALAGLTEAASDAWVAMGCLFEAGVVLLDSDDPDLVRRGLEHFESVGSRPAAGLAASRLRSMGARVPRGPNAATRGNAAGVTARELEVLALIAEGLRNADIARRLVISPKTVDHHVSSVLNKLGVATRQAAATEAAKLGLLRIGSVGAKDGEISR